MNKEPNKDLMQLLRAAESIEVTCLPEQMLLAEIIKRAVWDAFGSFREGKQDSQWSRRKCAHEAQSWLWDDSDKPWSYRWICQNINIAPDVLLNQIETRLISGQMVEELREPPNLTRALKARLEKRRKEQNEKNITASISNDLSGCEWGKLFSIPGARSNRSTWPDD